jgi:hypothetical protein
MPNIINSNLKNWKKYFKFSSPGNRGIAQMNYEPLINPEGNIFCANYDVNNEYQKIEGNRPLYTQEITEWFFEREVYYIEKFSKKPYAPEIIDIDFKQKKIFVKWYGYTCNEIIYGEGAWPKKDWLNKVEDIILDQCQSGIYKLTMYPHCHYIDNNDNMRAIDWYGVVDISDPYVKSKYMDAIIHDTAKHRLEETLPLVNGCYNLEIMFKRGLEKYVYWGNETLDFIYDKVFSE